MRRSNFQFAILLLPLVLVPVTSQSDDMGSGETVRVEIVEDIPEQRSWDFTPPEPIDGFTAETFGFVALPQKYSNRAILVDRSNPFLVRATATVQLPAGEYRVLLRAKNAARLLLDDERLLETDFVKGNASGHEAVPDVPAVGDDSLHPLPVGHQERVTTMKLNGNEHRFRLESFVGGQKLRMELGELLVAVAAPNEPLRLLTPSDKRIGLSDDDWPAYAAASRQRMKRHDAATRAAVGAEEAKYWQTRHELARREWSNRPAPAVPTVDGTTPVQNRIDHFIGKRLEERGVAPAPLSDDLAFLRRATLDTVGVIPTSTVPMAERSRRPLVQVTLEPGAKVDPTWPFTDLAPLEFPSDVLREPDNPRERFAALLTSPKNQRFAEVLVNRLWKRYIGLGLVEPVDDWADAEPSHPELLELLARELITHDYDVKHVARLILNSHTYQRAVEAGGDTSKDPANRLFAGPARRRMTAEQLVDSLFLAVGKEFGSEELCLDVDGRRPITEFLNLGTPRRAWEFTSLSNERDRPALSLPVAQSVVDLLTAYGWRESRQNPITVRDETPTPLQPLVLANGVVGNRITRLSDDSAITALSLDDRPLPDLVRAVYRQVLSRDPSATELDMFAVLLHEGYQERRKAGGENRTARQLAKASAVSWSNHLSPEATRLKLEQERAARVGDPPTERLQSEWRERMEDMLWALVNSPEFVFLP